jgi:hypothetical protein
MILPCPTLPRDLPAPTPSLSTSLRDILAAALQELIEAELTTLIGAAPGERTPDRVAQRNGHRPKLLSTPPATSKSASRSCAPARSSRSCSSPAAGSIVLCGR